ncbi:DegT/DnrJ/EryC1/StrS aminotransferase family protein [uncultured Clostridium sp.]|uniref:DegT/DnrJ/EryC1/StrS family aminotransferase n=1 Tax=uncultured Clostridium sp. TaxID=59620 RepID=UPI0025CF93EF|nr:DegT/DnrJ/EryC1/StrS family aminotransferase [uncultured Clostridium sp.]
MSILVTRSSMPQLDEFVEEIKPIFDSHWLTNMGPVYKRFQHQLKQYLSVPELSLFVNGHMALEIAIQALKLTGEVITTPYTFVSTTHAIVRNGLKPVFCDIKPDDYTMDPEKIEELITDKTSAIIPVHVYGNICDVEAIEKIAKKHNLKVIYDAAHAFGVTYKGVGVGNFGDASMFSFHATKVFHTIEGGAIAFADEKLKNPLHCLKNFGITAEDIIEEVGGNAKLDEFRAAMGICNLRHVDEEIEKRKMVYERYAGHLNGIDGLTLIRYNKDIKPNYSYFPLYIDEDKFGKNREEVYTKLCENDVFSRRYFYPATNDLDSYKDKFAHGETPVSERVSKNILTLPMYAELAMEDVDRICDLILSLGQ